MYELWLALNILWELALAAGPLVPAALAAWLALLGLALARRAQWRRGRAPALAVAAAVAVAVFVGLPGLTRSALGELRYWVDWANLSVIALTGGAIALAYAWPVCALRGTACPLESRR